MSNKKFATITFCIGYADFLKHTLPLNKQIFDKMIVVTSPDDYETQAVCQYNGVDCLATDKIFEVGKTHANKGLAVNTGLQYLYDSSDYGLGDWWVIQLDADICFTQPHVIRRILDQYYPLERDKLYGVDRMDVTGWDAWNKFLNHEVNPTHNNNCQVNMSHFNFGHRFVIYHWNVGYCPIGYFQMWNPAGSGIYKYPVHDGASVDHSDVQHAKAFKRCKRQLLPDFYAFHLMSGQDAQGANWYGRTTPRFGPDIPVTQSYEPPKKKETGGGISH